LFEVLASRPFLGESAPVIGEKLFENFQLMKRMLIAGEESVVVTAKDHMYILDVDDLTSLSSEQAVPYKEVLTWKSDNDTKAMCQTKLNLQPNEPKNRCNNFLRVIESYDERGDTFLLCGTNAYSPKCRRYQASYLNGRITFTEGDTMDGRRMCPYGPEQSGVARLTLEDESLYTATYAEFSGQTPVIRRDSDQLAQTQGFVRKTRHKLLCTRIHLLG
jgi:hypothetical protein